MAGYVVGLVQGYRVGQGIGSEVVSRKMDCQIDEMESIQVGVLANKADVVSACRLAVLLALASC